MGGGGGGLDPGGARGGGGGLSEGYTHGAYLFLEQADIKCETTQHNSEEKKCPQLLLFT